MARICLADNIYIALTSDYFTFWADFFDRCFNFHNDKKFEADLLYTILRLESKALLGSYVALF